MYILVTGVTGFIGYHLADRLLQENYRVIGIGLLESSQDLLLQTTRLHKLQRYSNFIFQEIDILHPEKLEALFSQYLIERVIHLSAKTGIRGAKLHPQTYIETNILGFTHILEQCRKFPVQKLILASSSSVYSNSHPLPFCEDALLITPPSIYGTTKLAQESLADNYCSLYGMSITALRLFTVYGAFYRSNMALSIFAQKLLAGDRVRIAGSGEVQRDFTHISDVVEVFVRSLGLAKKGYTVYNLGYGQPVPLIRVVKYMAEYWQKEPLIEFYPLEPEELVINHSDTSKLQKDFNYAPKVSIEAGIPLFLDWYGSFYGHGL